MLLEGVFPAIATPFYADGALYLRKLEHNVDRYSRSPIAGMVVLGSTGEAVYLSEPEQEEVLATAIAAAANEKVMIAGVGQESVLATLRLAEFAAKQRYDAVLVRTPHFYRAQMIPSAMLNYYRTVADRSALPVLLYSVPPVTKYELPTEVIAELCEHPNILGLKDSSGNPERIGQVVRATQQVKRTVAVTSVFAAVTERMQVPEQPAGAGKFVPVESLPGGSSTVIATRRSGADAVAAVADAVVSRASPKARTKEVGFQVLTGGAHTLHDSLKAGAVGAVLGLAAPAPQCCAEVYTAWKEGDEELAREKQERIVAPSTGVVSQMGIAGIKYACDLNGYYGGKPRLPLLPLTAEQRTQVEMLMGNVRY